MRQERVLQVLLVLVGLFFIAGIYPLLTSIPQHQQSDYGDQMMLAVYFVLGVFLLLAVRRPAAHRSLISFTGWGTLAHDCDGNSSFAVETVALGTAALDRNCVSLCRVDRIIFAEATT